MSKGTIILEISHRFEGFGPGGDCKEITDAMHTAAFHAADRHGYDLQTKTVYNQPNTLRVTGGSDEANADVRNEAYAAGEKVYMAE